MKYTTGRKIYIAFSATVLAALLILIFRLSAQTATESDGTSGSVIALIYALFGKLFTQETVRTLAHFCEFACLGFLTSNFIFSLKLNCKPILSAGFSLLYAVSDEIHQIFVPGRACQLIDLTVDFGGIILGTAVFSLVVFVVRKIKNIQNN